MKRLLFILPDITNENILIIKNQSEYQVPVYDQLVDENVGFENPNPFNKYFRQSTGMAVFRRYTFSYKDYCVFVLEAKDEINNLKGDCSWVKYDEIIKIFTDKTISEIILSVRDTYNKSLNMPWVNEKGFAPYVKWVKEIAGSKGLDLTGEITQIKNTYGATVFEILTNGGNLYLKIPGTIYAREIDITLELMKWNIARLPEWLGFDSYTNAILMKDMGGQNLSDIPDINALKAVLRQYARLQKESIKYADKNPSSFYDYRIESILVDLSSLPQKIYMMLENTQYQISDEELDKFKFRIEEARRLLHTLDEFGIPDTIDHGDLRSGNIRITGNGYMFYDWAWSSISHPFVSVSQFLHFLRKAFPDYAAAKEILIESYLGEWIEYGEITHLKKAYSIVENLKFLFMIYGDYHWLDEILCASGAKIDEKSADGWLLSRRYYYFARVLKGIAMCSV